MGDTTDDDGKKIEFFRDGKKIGETTVKFTPDRGSVTFTPDDGPLPPSILNTAALDLYLDLFGRARAEMLPAVPEKWTLLQRVVWDCCRDPKSELEADQLTGDALLHIRDQRYGWLHYVLSKDQARELGAALIAQADAPAPASAGMA